MRDAPPRADRDAVAAFAFDAAVPANGYRWWYLDAISDDGAHGLTLIAFIGSVFSPYYAHARRRGASVAAAEHCALNVALYRPRGGGGHWAMTERGAASLTRDARRLAIGPSELRCVGDALEIAVAEVACPWPRALRGRLRVSWPGLARRTFTLDAAGAHRWRPLAPSARIEVDWEQPRLRWHGRAYVDSNHGGAPLESAFRGWHWSRAALTDGATRVHYDVTEIDGATRAIAVHYDRSGADRTLSNALPLQPLAATRWGIARAARSDSAPALLATLEDTPFYARSLVRLQSGAESWDALHESLSLQTLQSPLGAGVAAVSHAAAHGVERAVRPLRLVGAVFVVAARGVAPPTALRGDQIGDRQNQDQRKEQRPLILDHPLRHARTSAGRASLPRP